MSTIDINTSEQTSTVTTDHMSLLAVCLFALLGLAGILSMTI